MSGASGNGLGRLRGLLGGKAEGAVRPSDTTSARPLTIPSDLAIGFIQDFERAGNGWFWSSDSTGRLIYVSEQFAAKYGKLASEMAGLPLTSLFVSEQTDEEKSERSLQLMISARKPFSELPLHAAIDDDEIWWSVSGRPQRDRNGEFTGYYGNGSDITASRQSRKDASRLALFDSLTGLSNRHSMEKRLSTTLTAYQAAKRSCALMMLDLDRFKQVNDTLGHPAGDELLRQVAQRLQRIIPENCEIGRLGGDEFQVILPDIDDRGKLGEIGKKIIEIISQPYSIDGSRCVIGASVGIAIAPYDGINNEEIVRSADLALYAAKAGGRGQFRFYSIDLHAEAERRRLIEEELRDALPRNELHLAYQPVVDASTNIVVALEAVMRWTHPELGEVSPGIFIPIAEETNQIGVLGDWALKQACSEVVNLPANVRVAVNVSAVQFSNLAFPTLVTQALAASGLPPERLELEVTESIFLGDEDSLHQTFNALKIMGVRLALDDFGTGYSSLGYLRKVSFDKIKIDQSFIRGVTEPGSRNRAIIKSIVSLAEGLNMDVTAEGIEAHDELACMRELSVKQIQGFIYARAVTAAEVHEAMESGEWIIEPTGPSKYRPDRMTVLRKIGLIHEDHRYDVTMRNMSRNGCLIEGLVDVPVGTPFVVDFGEGQLAVAQVRRSAGAMQGLEFETPLVDDGAGGLCTRSRVSPYVLAAAGMPLGALPAGAYPLMPQNLGALSIPKFGQVNEAGRAAIRKQG